MTACEGAVSQKEKTDRGHLTRPVTPSPDSPTTGDPPPAQSEPPIAAFGEISPVSVLAGDTQSIGNIGNRFRPQNVPATISATSNDTSVATVTVGTVAADGDQNLGLILTGVDAGTARVTVTGSRVVDDVHHTAVQRFTVTVTSLPPTVTATNPPPTVIPPAGGSPRVSVFPDLVTTAVEGSPAPIRARLSEAPLAYYTNADWPFELTRQMSVSVAWSTVDGTAKAGTDYTAADGTFTFAAGSLVSNTASVTILDDDVVESKDEPYIYFRISLSSVSVVAAPPATIVERVCVNDPDCTEMEKQDIVYTLDRKDQVEIVVAGDRFGKVEIRDNDY